MDRWKSRGGKSQRREEETRSEKRKSEKKKKKKTQVRENVAKPRNTLFFSNVLWLRRSKGRLSKAAGAGPCGQMRDEKLHTVVARSTCPSQRC